MSQNVPATRTETGIQKRKNGPQSTWERRHDQRTIYSRMKQNERSSHTNTIYLREVIRPAGKPRDQRRRETVARAASVGTNGEWASIHSARGAAAPFPSVAVAYRADKSSARQKRVSKKRRASVGAFTFPFTSPRAGGRAVHHKAKVWKPRQATAADRGHDCETPPTRWRETAAIKQRLLDEKEGAPTRYPSPFSEPLGASVTSGVLKRLRQIRFARRTKSSPSCQANATGLLAQTVLANLGGNLRGASADTLARSGPTPLSPSRTHSGSRERR